MYSIFRAKYNRESPILPNHIVPVYQLTTGYYVDVSVRGTFKYHVSCTDGKISVRINLLFHHYFPP